MTHPPKRSAGMDGKEMGTVTGLMAQMEER